LVGGVRWLAGWCGWGGIVSLTIRNHPSRPDALTPTTSPFTPTSPPIRTSEKSVFFLKRMLHRLSINTKRPATNGAYSAPPAAGLQCRSTKQKPPATTRVTSGLAIRCPCNPRNLATTRLILHLCQYGNRPPCGPLREYPLRGKPQPGFGRPGAGPASSLSPRSPAIRPAISAEGRGAGRVTNRPSFAEDYKRKRKKIKRPKESKGKSKTGIS